MEESFDMSKENSLEDIRVNYLEQIQSIREKMDKLKKSDEFVTFHVPASCRRQV